VYPISGGFRGPGTWAWAQTAVGYNLELQIPAAEIIKNDTILFPLVDEQEIGFEISNADRDNDVVGRETVAHWWTTSGLTWADPSLFGTAVLSRNEVDDKLKINKTEIVPTLNGIMDEGEWDVANEITLENFEGFPNDSLILKSWGDHFTTAYTMWDADNFYAFVKVLDDSICTGDPAAPWNDDCIEIFFDGDNHKGISYNAYDVQWRWVYGITDTTTVYPISGGFRGPGTWAWAQTAGGFNLELQIPAAEIIKNDTILFSLLKDTEIGFEISNADRDNDVDGRTSVRHWWATSGLTWADPSLFGTAVLIGGPATEISFTLVKSEKVKLTIYNLLGKEVAVLVNGMRNAGPQTVTFNAKNLSSGVYFYKLETGSSVLSKKMMLLK
jgi:hypothetical protein